MRYRIKIDLNPIASSEAVAEPSASLMIPSTVFQASVFIAAMAVRSASDVAVELPVRWPRPA